MYKVFDAWIVAAAILELEGRSLHYAEIADRVVRSGLSILGYRGSTPAQTMGVILRSHNIFERLGEGLYRLRNGISVRKNIRVVMALAKLEQNRRQDRQDAAGGE